MKPSNRPDRSFAGNAFELNLQLLFLHRGYRHNYSFKSYREKSDAGIFDDLVFAFEKNGTTVYRFLQTKYYVDPEKNKVFEQMLFGRIFDLVLYLQSYRIIKQNYEAIGKIKDIIFCTNCFLDEKFKNEIDEIKEEDDILDVEFDGRKTKKFHLKKTQEIIDKIKKEWENRIGNWKSDKRKMMPLLPPALTEGEIVDFLNLLTFVSDIPDVYTLGFILESEIGDDFDVTTRKDIYNRAYKRILAWNTGDDRRDFWTDKNAEALFDEVKTGFVRCKFLHNVQPPVKQFIGRIEQLHSIHELLQTKKRVMICGLGGVGKTELVNKYIEIRGREYVDNILWINAENDEALESSFREIVNELGIKTKILNHEEVKIGSVIQKVYEWFKQSKTLFIFDNAKWEKLPTYICPSLPEKINEPYIIITSRKKWRNKNIINFIELNVFTESEATNFISNSLSAFLNNDQQDDSIKKLAETLNYLPLALKQATAYISAKFQYEPDTNQIFKYIENFSRKSVKYLDYDFSDYCDSGYNKTVWTTWDDSLRSVQRKSSYTRDVLNYMSFFLPDNIKQELLLKLLGEDLKLKKAVRLLNDYSLITAREKIYNVHRLVQLVTREKLKLAEKREILVTILGAVAENDVIVARSIDHFISAWTHFKEICNDLILKYYHIPAIIALTLFDVKRHEEAYFFGVEALKLISLLSLIDEKGELYVQNIAPIIVFKMLCNRDYEEAQEILEIHRVSQHGMQRFQKYNYHKNWRGKLSWKLEEAGLMRERTDSGLGSDASSKLKTCKESLLEVNDFDRFDSVKSGHLEHLKKLIEKSADVNVKKEKECTQFHEAASAVNPEIVGFLLRMGTKEFENAALHAAVANHCFTFAKEFLDPGFDESEMLIQAKKKSEGNKALHIASLVRSLEMEVDTDLLVAQLTLPCSDVDNVDIQSGGIQHAQRNEKAFDLQGPENQLEQSSRLKTFLIRNLLKVLLEVVERYEKNHNHY